MNRILQILVIILVLAQNINSQWWPFIEQSSGTSANLTSGSQPAWFKVWVCGYNGTVIKTTNYGMNWTNGNGNLPSSIELVNIFGINDSVVLTVGNIGDTTFVYRTSNNGINWTRVFTQRDGYLNAVWMRTATTGFMMGDPVGGRWSLWKTTNGGINWDSTGLRLLQAGTEYGYNNCLFCSQNYIWFGTNNYRIYYSSDYGQNWIVQPTPSSQTIRAIYRGMLSTFLAGGSQLLESTNNGLNWTPVSNLPGTGNITGITEPNPGVIQGMPNINGIPLVSRQNRVYIHAYWLQRWDTIYTAPAGINYLFKSFNEPNNIWGGGCFALRSSGGLAVCACQLGDVKSLGNVIPEKFYLYQNYPNPFNPSTKIKFDVALDSRLRGNDIVSLKIYDILGREIATLVNEHLSPGTYEVEWDGSNYPSGVYFYKLIVGDASASSRLTDGQAGHGYSETRKMILLK